MNIAYICYYQGDDLLKQRPIIRGRSLGATEKSKLVAMALADAGHQVCCIAEGIPTERSGRYFPSFESTLENDPRIKVIYPAGLDFKFINNLWGRLSNYPRLFFSHRNKPFDAIIIYNLPVLHLCYVFFARHILHVPVIVDYEDDACVSLDGKIRVSNRITRFFLKLIRPMVAGCFAISPSLLEQFPGVPGIVLRGIVAKDIWQAPSAKEQIAVYCGGLSEQKGVDRLVQAWGKCNRPDWKLFVCGSGPLSAFVESCAKRDSTICFKGHIDRAALVEILQKASICINPHRLTDSPGNIFPFKIAEYIASGAHVVTTPMCAFDNEMRSALIVSNGDSVESLTNAIETAMVKKLDTQVAVDYVKNTYGAEAVSLRLDALLNEMVQRGRRV